MANRLQQRRSGSSDTVWLATLIQTFESVSRDAVKPSDATTIARLKAQLAGPAAARAENLPTVQ